MKKKKKILIISIVLAVIGIIVYYLHEDTVVFKINYGVSIPQSIEYNYILPGDGYADLPMYNQLVFRKQFTQKYLSSFKKIDQNNKEKLIQLIEVYYNKLDCEGQVLFKESFPPESINENNYFFVKMTEKRLSILIYDEKNKTLHELSTISHQGFNINLDW